MMREWLESLGLGRYTTLFEENMNSRSLNIPCSLRGVSRDSKNLPYPKASAHAAPCPMQRHLPWSIATARFRLARTLPRCPCCGVSEVRQARYY